MGKAERQARRAARKAGRAERKKQLGRLLDAISSGDINFKPDGDSNIPFIDVFKDIWKILDPALKYAIAMRKTKAKTDAALQDVWDAGNALANGGSAADQTAFISKFTAIWDTIDEILDVIQHIPFVPKKVDDAIDKIQEIGEWIADGGADEDNGDAGGASSSSAAG